MPISKQSEPEAVGWDAINQALTPIYGAKEPAFHYGTVLPAFLGGQDYLQGISVYRRPKPIPHWHYVTYGFTELYEKESDDPEESGYGFELTFRLTRHEKEPPAWVIGLLQNLGRYVFQSGNIFAEGHYLNCEGKIALQEETDLRAILFTNDPELKATKSPNGRFHFLEVIGITLDEFALIRRWNAQGFLKAIRKIMPLYITNLKRRSVLLDEAIGRKLERLAKKEGSNWASLFVGEAHFSARGKKLRIILGANAVKELKEVLVPRLGFSRPLQIVSSGGSLHFLPGDVFGWKKVSGDNVEITMSADAAARLSDCLLPKAGSYNLVDLPAIEFEVRPSEIKDSTGKVVEVIG